MLRQITQKSSYCNGVKLVLYCTVPAEHKMAKESVAPFAQKPLRPFAKDMLLNQFNLDLFTYPEVGTSARVDKVNDLLEGLERLMALTRDGGARTDLMEAFSRSGIMGVCAPERFGGADYDCMMMCRVMEAIAADDAAFALDALQPQLLATQAILLAGSETQRERYLPRIASGAVRAALAIDERDIAAVARLDEAKGEYALDGAAVANYGGDSDAHLLIVLARTSERLASAFIVDAAADGVAMVDGDVRLDNVRVATTDMLAGAPATEIARRVAALANVTVAACASGIGKALLRSANAFVCDTAVFGRPLAQRELVQYRIAALASDAYGAESAAFFTAGVMDAHGDSDWLLESVLARINGEEALSRAVERCLRLAGAKCEGSAFDNAHALLQRQSPLMKRAAMRESVAHVLSAGDNRKSIGDYIARLTRKDSLKAVLGNTIITDSLAFNLHPRLGELTYKLYRDLRLMKAFIEKATTNESLLGEDVVLDKLANVVGHLYSIVATLSRASRAMSIGLRNHDQEVNVAEFHYTERVRAMRTELEQLNRIADDAGAINACAEMVKAMRDGLLIDGFVRQ